MFPIFLSIIYLRYTSKICWQLFNAYHVLGLMGLAMQAREVHGSFTPLIRIQGVKQGVPGLKQNNIGALIIRTGFWGS